MNISIGLFFHFIQLFPAISKLCKTFSIEPVFSIELTYPPHRNLPLSLPMLPLVGRLPDFLLRPGFPMLQEQLVPVLRSPPDPHWYPE